MSLPTAIELATNAPERDLAIKRSRFPVGLAVPVVEDTLLRRPAELSLRSAQRHFLRSTGITYATFRQIERARYATNLLREGASIFDVVVGAGYFDQAHLTRSLKRFIGETPAKIIQGQKQLSFLYNTNLSAEAIVLPEMARSK